MLEELNENDKYYPLQEELRRLREDNGNNLFTLTLREINNLLTNGVLPNSAYDNGWFWRNELTSPSHRQKRAWLSLNLRVVERNNLNLIEQTGRITFGPY